MIYLVLVGLVTGSIRTPTLDDHDDMSGYFNNLQSLMDYSPPSPTELSDSSLNTIMYRGESSRDASPGGTALNRRTHSTGSSRDITNHSSPAHTKTTVSASDPSRAQYGSSGPFLAFVRCKLAENPNLKSPELKRMALDANLDIPVSYRMIVSKARKPLGILRPCYKIPAGEVEFLKEFVRDTPACFNYQVCDAFEAKFPNSQTSRRQVSQWRSNRLWRNV